MGLPPLTPEIVVRILKYVPLSDLKYFHENLPDGFLRSFIESFLFEKLIVSHSFEEDLHRVSIEELYKLAKGELKATVKVLEFGRLGDVNDQEAFVTFCFLTQEFIASIPEIIFSGGFEYYARYAAAVSTDNIVNWKINGFMPSQGLRQNVKDVSIYFGFRDMPVRDWPQTIKRFKIEGCENCDIIELPAGLEELECKFSEPTWTSFPGGLKKLAIAYKDIDIRQIVFPELLIELDINCQFPDDMLLVTWPSNLEVLRIRHPPFSSLSKFQFPPKLQVFDLEHGYISTLEGTRFPSLLK